jgi:hypothetical protein
MDRGDPPRNAPLPVVDEREHHVGLFRRKNDLEPEPERCPLCTERVPEDAQECAMCGADLRTLLRRPETGGQEKPAA